MSTLTKVCFDASIHDGCIGIGIFNFDTKEELKFRFKCPTDSFMAEKMALVKTIQYLKTLCITSAHIFTDNQGIANEGISKNIKNGLKDVNIHWIPREFNEDADRLSKEAHLLDPIIFNNNKNPHKTKTTTNIPKTTKLFTPTNMKLSNKTLFDCVINSSTEKKINLLKHFADKQYKRSLLTRLLDGDTNFVIPIKKYRTQDKVFFRLLRTLFSNITLETPKTIKFKRFNSDALSSHIFNIGNK